MQPIIDIIYELCQNFIDTYFATHPPVCCFTDRGDPGTMDWGKLDLTGDNTWRTLDLSGIVPEKTSAVILRIGMEASASTREIRFRKKGHTGWPNVAECKLPAANQGVHYDKTVAVDVDRKIQYKLNSPTWTVLVITVAAWYVGGDVVGGFHNRGDPAADDFTESDFTAYQVWTDLDLTGIIPASTSCIVVRIRVWSGSNQRSLRFRTKGHSNSVNISQCEAVQSGLSYYYDIQVPTNGLQTIQYWSSLGQSPIVRATVKGWWY